MGRRRIKGGGGGAAAAAGAGAGAFAGGGARGGRVRDEGQWHRSDIGGTCRKLSGCGQDWPSLT